MASLEMQLLIVFCNVLLLVISQSCLTINQGHKTVLMLNPNEREMYPSHNCKKKLKSYKQDITKSE